jgi:hypothetical protein
MSGSRFGAAGASQARSFAYADGQWHSFGSPTNGRGSAGPSAAAEARGSANAGSGWQSFGANRSAGTGSARSWSGQGHSVWNDTSQPRNTVSPSRALSNIRGSFGFSALGASRLMSNASLSARSGLGSSLPARSNVRAFGGVGGSFGGGNRFGSFGNGNRFGGFRGGNHFGRFGLGDFDFDDFGFGRFGFGGGCWGCGFGWGLGFGSPWLGIGYWQDPWSWFGYGYPAINYYSAPYDYNAPGDYVGPYYPPVSGAQPYVLLYLKDGAVFSVTDYWLADGRLHYTLGSGAEIAIDVDQLDLQRTVDENGSRSVPFTLKPGPTSSNPAPGHR